MAEVRQTTGTETAQRMLARFPSRPTDDQLRAMAARENVSLADLVSARDQAFASATQEVARSGAASSNFRAMADTRRAAATFGGANPSSLYGLRTAALTNERSAGADLARGIEAARANDARALDAWMAAGGDLHARDQFGLTVLHHAAVMDNPEITKALLVRLRNDPARDEILLPSPTTNIPSPLLLAAQGNAVDAAKVLLEAEPKMLNHIFGLNAHTPLVEAAFNNNLEMVNFLLSFQSGEHRVDTGALTIRGLSASDLAQRALTQNENAPRILEALNSHNRALGLPDVGGGRYDHTAEQKQARLADIMAQIEPSPRGSPAWYDALISVVQRTPTYPPNATPDERARILREFDQNLLNEVRTLVDTAQREGNRIDFDQLGQAMGTTPLIEASVRGYEQVVRYLLDERGADPLVHEDHPMGITALFKSAVFGFPQIARAILENVRERSPQRLSEAVNEQGAANGMTPLHDALARASLDVAELLLEFGARTDIPSHRGETQRDIIRTNSVLRERVQAAQDRYPRLAELL